MQVEITQKLIQSIASLKKIKAKRTGIIYYRILESVESIKALDLFEKDELDRLIEKYGFTQTELQTLIQSIVFCFRQSADNKNLQIFVDVFKEAEIDEEYLAQV